MIVDSNDYFSHAMSILDDETVRYAFKDGTSIREIRGEDHLVFFDRGCAQAGAQVMCVASTLYVAAGYFGEVDLLFEVPGCEGAIGFD